MAAICMMVIMMPLFFLGMFEKDGQPLEKIARQFIEAKFVRPKIRPYKTNNYYSALIRQAQAKEEVKTIVCQKKPVSKTGKKKTSDTGKSDKRTAASD